MITVTAEQQVLAAKAEELDALMVELISNIRIHEPGCLRFDYVVDSADPRRRLCIEPYRDETAFAQHNGSSYLAEFIPQLLDCLAAPPTVVRFEDIFASTAAATFFHT